MCSLTSWRHVRYDYLSGTTRCHSDESNIAYFPLDQNNDFYLIFVHPDILLYRDVLAPCTMYDSNIVISVVLVHCCLILLAFHKFGAGCMVSLVNRLSLLMHIFGNFAGIYSYLIEGWYLCRNVCNGDMLSRHSIKNYILNVELSLGLI